MVVTSSIRVTGERPFARGRIVEFRADIRAGDRAMVTSGDEHLPVGEPNCDLTSSGMVQAAGKAGSSNRDGSQCSQDQYSK